MQISPTSMKNNVEVSENIKTTSSIHDPVFLLLDINPKKEIKNINLKEYMHSFMFIAALFTIVVIETTQVPNDR